MKIIEIMIAVLDSILAKRQLYYKTEDYDYYITTSRSGGCYIWTTKPSKKRITNVTWFPSAREAYNNVIACSYANA